MRSWLSSLRSRLAATWASDKFRQLASNTGWLLGERVVMLGLSLVMSVWTARYLGLDGFGILSYAIAFVSLFGTFTYLGFSGVVTRDLVADPQHEREILGTAFVLKLLGALTAVSIVAAVTLRSHDGQTAELVLVLAAALPFDAFTVITFWYHSRVQARYAVLASTSAAFAVAAGKAALIISGQPLVWFAVATACQGMITALGLAAVYRGHGRSPLGWRFRRGRARELLTQSWPLAVSSVVAAVYLKIDQVMLGSLADHAAVGTYAVAARLSEIWYAVPATLAVSVFPSIVRARTETADRYHALMERLYRGLFLLSLAIAIPVSLLASPIIDLLYGAEFEQAAGILSVHIWACPAMFMGALMSKWLIAEGYMTFALVRDSLGAVINIALNWLLIPHFAGLGAAVATLIAYTFASYLSSFLDRRTRPAGLLMTRAIFYPLTFVAGCLRRPGS